jgi:hypothetical protein
MEILERCKASDYFFGYKETQTSELIFQELKQRLSDFISQKKSWEPSLVPLNSSHCQVSTKILLQTIEKVIEK